MINPVRNFMVGEKEEDKGSSGLIIPKGGSDTFEAYKVISVGPDADEYEVNDVVIFPEDQVNKILYKGKTYNLLCAEFVSAKVSE